MHIAPRFSTSRPIIAVTCGDVAGVGPEVVVRSVAALQAEADGLPLLVGHPEILKRAARLTQVTMPLQVLTDFPSSRADLWQQLKEAESQRLRLCWNPLTDDVLAAAPGRISASAGDAAFRCLIDAIRLAQSGTVDGIATAPLNKEALHLAGHHFPGHTEILAEQCGVTQFAMMLYLPETRLAPLRKLIRPESASADGGFPPGDPSRATSPQGLSIAHVTLHTSIASVPQLLSVRGVIDTTQLVDHFLTRIGCERRSVAVCALNPHAGENGLFGDEEQLIIAPAVSACQSDGMRVTGPLPADTLIRRAVSGEFDGVVAMYHDQGHIPVKLIGFDAAVNITLGLPIIRTSPTHGTAFDRAWNAATPADPSGMLEAIRMAAQLARGQSHSSSDQ